MAQRRRIDVLLVERGLLDSRERARRAVMAGLVFCDGRRVEKPGEQVPESAELVVRGDPVPYVSRGGLKLAGALEAFGVDPEGMTALDVGASTGGFTDCLLKRGARKVYAVDVGYGQLDWRLRQDPRVVVMERTNIRYLDPAALPEPVDLVTVDVSFISIDRFLGRLQAFLGPGGLAIVLVKPQFEAGRAQVGKRGVVRDPEVHREVLLRAIAAARAAGFSVLGLVPSPILGPEGNREFFLYLKAPELQAPGAQPPAPSVPEPQDREPGPAAGREPQPEDELDLEEPGTERYLEMVERALRGL